MHKWDKFQKEFSIIVERYLLDRDSNNFREFAELKNENETLISLSSGEGLEDEEFLSLMSRVASLTRPTSDRKFFNLLFGGFDIPSVFAEMLVPVFNTTMHTYKTAGIHVLIENEVISRINSAVGWNNSDGIFTPGGSISNYYAMLLARNNYSKETMNDGVIQGMKVYASKDAHYSIRKNADAMGIGRKSVVLIPVNKDGSMSIELLEKAIELDLSSGFKPFMVIATAGTTTRGSFDNLTLISNICKKYNLWLHTDMTWGGALLFSKDKKVLLTGVDLSDSVSWNPHKFMGVPLIASMILVKKKDLLVEQFSAEADYLFQTENNDINPGQKSLQCGRRNDALKVWAALKYHGMDGLRVRLERLYMMRDYLLKEIKKSTYFELYEEPNYLNINFKLVDEDARVSCERLELNDSVRVSYSRIEENFYIRFIMINPDLKKRDIDLFLELLKNKTN